MNTLPEPLKPFPSPAMVRGLSTAAVVTALAVAAMSDPAPPDTVRRKGIVASEFEGSWRRGANVDLVKTLDANHVEGCSEVAYRAHRTHTGEYLVYCTQDGRKWSAWLVSTANVKANGPYPPDPLLPLPQ
jgi:hypothetical protein